MRTYEKIDERRLKIVADTSEAVFTKEQLLDIEANTIAHQTRIQEELDRLNANPIEKPGEKYDRRSDTAWQQYYKYEDKKKSLEELRELGGLANAGITEYKQKIQEYELKTRAELDAELVKEQPEEIIR